jgi:hypothetical protein
VGKRCIVLFLELLVLTSQLVLLLISFSIPTTATAITSAREEALLLGLA